jgi:hypothetical protein
MPMASRQLTLRVVRFLKAPPSGMVAVPKGRGGSRWRECERCDCGEWDELDGCHGIPFPGGPKATMEMPL